LQPFVVQAIVYLWYYSPRAVVSGYLSLCVYEFFTRPAAGRFSSFGIMRCHVSRGDNNSPSAQRGMARLFFSEYINIPSNMTIVIASFEVDQTWLRIRQHNKGHKLSLAMVNTSKSFAEKTSWKVLLTDLLCEKNIIPSLKNYGWKDKRVGPHIPKPTLKLSPQSKTSTEIFCSHRYSSNSRARGDR
jgi:hypothetical protein